MLYPLILATAVCMYSWIYFNYLDDESIPRPSPAWGEKLQFSQLRPTEEIAIATSHFGCRSTGEEVRWKYFVTGDDPSRFQALAEGGPAESPSKPKEISRLLTTAETEGLDVTLRYLRSIDPPLTYGYTMNTYSYYRAGQKIGEESFFAPYFIYEITSYTARHEEIPNKNDWAYNIIQYYGISRDDLDRMLTPEMLAVTEPINTTTITDKKKAANL